MLMRAYFLSLAVSEKDLLIAKSDRKTVDLLEGSLWKERILHASADAVVMVTAS